jgi:hypothetical protein
MQVDFAEKHAVRTAYDVRVIALRSLLQNQLYQIPIAFRKVNAAGFVVVTGKTQLVAPVVGHRFGVAQELFSVPQIVLRVACKSRTFGSTKAGLPS